MSEMALAPSSASCWEALLVRRPEVVDQLAPGAEVGAAGRADDQLGVLGPLVPDRADHLGCDPHRCEGPGLQDLVVELELELPGDHEVDLLLGVVAVAVAPLAAGPRGHPPVGERHLL